MDAEYFCCSAAVSTAAWSWLETDPAIFASELGTAGTRSITPGIGDA